MQPVQRPFLFQPVDQLQHLRGGESELGLLATGVLPLAARRCCQPDTHTEQRLDLHLSAQGQHQFELVRFFDDDMDAQSHPAADQGETDVLAVLVAVAYHNASGFCERQHGKQFRLGARLQSDAVSAAAQQLFDNTALLVDLDRIDRAVAATVIMCPGGFREGVAQ